MKRRDPILISDIINQMSDSDPNFYERILCVRAKKLCQEYFKAIIKYINNIEINDSTLKIGVTSPNMKQYIIMDKHVIIESINKSLGVYLIRDIVVF